MDVAVIGAGNIGNAFSLVFAAGGHEVRLCDADEKQRQQARERIAASLRDLEAFGLCGQHADAVLSRIHVCAELADAVRGVSYVQECVPERIELKRALFTELIEQAPEHAVLASSTSAITASEFATGPVGRERCLVVHPGNPPFLLRVVEVVPAPFTSADTVERTCTVMRSVGLSPIMVRKEIAGFVFNRLQGAMLREAYCLVRDGVVGVDDLDRLVRDGLGLRWAVTGPFETADLNRHGGIRSHARIMGDAYAAMGADRGQDDPWTDDLVARVEAERRALLPLDEWQQRVSWRDRELMKLLAARVASGADG
jgi:3-hydroxyacyl-CoA dehydrogenase